MTYYGLEIPEIGDYAIGVITDIQETVGYFLTLPEYDNIRAFVGLRDVSRCRFKKLKGIVKEGNIEVVEITSIDGTNIDASRRNLDEKRVEECTTRYRSQKKILDWLHFTDYYEKSIKDEYISQVLHRPGLCIPQNLIDLHDKLSKLTAASQELISSQDIRIPAVSRCSVNNINTHLQFLRDRFALDITVAVTRKSTYRMTPTNPLTKEDMQALVDNILQYENYVEQHANSDHRQSKVDHDCDGRQPTVNIGIIGHVSHGKSTIVSCLTGVDTRRHKKEIQSNRTLHLGYTNIKITECKCKSEVEYISGETDCGCPCILASIVDCPGHHVLLSTMISGAHIMDACIAVIAANEVCPQKQTQEHVDIIQIIGKTHGMLVVQNKVDIPSIDDLKANHTQIHRFLRDCDLEDSPVVPVSAQKAINCSEILKWIYLYVKQHDDSATRDEQTADPYGIVVRTFDINKPGAHEVRGIVIGGSISRGRFRVGQEILILPQQIKTHIISLRSDVTEIGEARPGGLIAIQTDMNPSFTDHLVGSTFTFTNKFQQQKLLQKDSVVEAKYYMHNDSPISSFKPGVTVNLNILAQTVSCTVLQCRKSKCELQIHSSIYLHDALEFIITLERRLIGYGRCLKSPRGQDIAQPITLPCLANYEDLLENATELLRSVEYCKVHLPVPKTVYLNTFTTVSNFASICDKLCAKPHQVGMYIHSELGTRSWSVNNQSQLILKGRSNENRIMTVLRPFITNKKCVSCKSLNTEVFTDRGVKKQKCNNCSWAEVKQSL